MTKLDKKFAPAVDSSMITDGTITDADLASESVGTEEIKDGSIEVEDLSPEVQSLFVSPVGAPLKLSVSPVSTPVPAPSGTYGTLFGSSYIQATRGIWIFVIRLSISANGASFTSGDGLLGLSTDSLPNSFSDRADGDTSNFISGLSGLSIGGRTFTVLRTVLSTTNFYAKLRVSFTGGTPHYGCTFEAVKIGNIP